MPIPLLEPSVREAVRRIHRRVQEVPGVEECEVHVDGMGKKPHVRLLVLLDGNPGFEKTHVLSARIDDKVRGLIPNARVSIRTEPSSMDRPLAQETWNLVRRIADHEPGSRGAHNFHIEKIDGDLGIDFHLEVGSGLTAKQVHEVVSRVEKKLRAADPKISKVIIHQETPAYKVSNERSGHGSELAWFVVHNVARFPDAAVIGAPVIRRIGDGKLGVIVHLSLAPGVGEERASQIVRGLDSSIKEGFNAIAKVEVVFEPTRNYLDPAGRQRV